MSHFKTFLLLILLVSTRTSIAQVCENSIKLAAVKCYDENQGFSAVDSTFADRNNVATDAANKYGDDFAQCNIAYLACQSECGKEFRKYQSEGNQEKADRIKDISSTCAEGGTIGYLHNEMRMANYFAQQERIETSNHRRSNSNSIAQGLPNWPF